MPLERVGHSRSRRNATSPVASIQMFVTIARTGGVFRDIRWFPSRLILAAAEETKCVNTC